MHILIATPLLPPESGGPATYAIGLRDSFSKLGHAVDVVAFREVRHLPPIIRHMMYGWKIFWRARSVDVVIVLDTVSVALPAVLAARLSRKPVIIRTGGDFVWERYIERTKHEIPLSKVYIDSTVAFTKKEKFVIWLQANVIFPLTAALVFSTKWQHDIWYIPYHLSRRRVDFIDNAYRPELHATRSTQYSQIVLWAGRPIVLKNVPRLDTAMTMLTDVPHIYTKVSGVTPSELATKIAEAGVLVIPSISEVSPNQALEALALGTPVILTKECGLAEELAPYVRLVDPLDTEAIAAAIREMLHPETQARWRERIAAYELNRTYDEVAADLLVLCEQITTTRK